MFVHSVIVKAFFINSGHRYSFCKLFHMLNRNLALN
jgi:hypothetical protein